MKLICLCDWTIQEICFRHRWIHVVLKWVIRNLSLHLSHSFRMSLLSNRISPCEDKDRHCKFSHTFCYISNPSSKTSFFLIVPRKIHLYINSSKEESCLFCFQIYLHMLEQFLFGSWCSMNRVSFTQDLTWATFLSQLLRAGG